MKKRVLSAEVAYLLGIVMLALGVAFMERADFGVSMVVAPAYLIYCVLSPSCPWFTFGMAEYCLQAVLLIGMCLLLRRFKVAWMFSFVTAVVYGFVLDGCMLLVARIPADTVVLQGLWYVVGMLLCSGGVSMMFHTYIAPEVYELFVKEVSAGWHVEIHHFKTGYDCVSCAAGLIMSFAFFGLWHFVGVKLGTILCALVNGWIIGRFSAFFEKKFEFKDALPWRKFFEA